MIKFNIGKILQKKYPKVVNGIGKLKSRAIKLHIDPNVKPVAQLIRRAPFSLRSNVEEKIRELVDLYTIEPAHPMRQPSSCRPNVRRHPSLHRHAQSKPSHTKREAPNPLSNEITKNLNGSKVFSKLNLK